MGKRSKGLDAVRQRNLLKKSILSSCKKYAEQLEAENYALKNDPSSVIGQFIGQFRELYGQNQRLSVLAACLLAKQGDKVVLTKDEMEAFEQKRINIKWELPEGVEKIEDATEFTFTYETEAAPPQGQPVQATEQPTPAAIASAAITDEAVASAENEGMVTADPIEEFDEAMEEESEDSDPEGAAGAAESPQPGVED